MPSRALKSALAFALVRGSWRHTHHLRLAARGVVANARNRHILDLFRPACTLTVEVEEGARGIGDGAGEAGDGASGDVFEALAVDAHDPGEEEKGDGHQQLHSERRRGLV